MRLLLATRNPHKVRELAPLMAPYELDPLPASVLMPPETEDTFAGSMTSNLWHCRTYNRHELKRYCEECGLVWTRPLYFSKVHRFFKLGGIIVELHKPQSLSTD